MDELTDGNRFFVDETNYLVWFHVGGLLHRDTLKAKCAAVFAEGHIATANQLNRRRIEFYQNFNTYFPGQTKESYYLVEDNKIMNLFNGNILNESGPQGGLCVVEF